jgi:hypothetical protein
MFGQFTVLPPVPCWGRVDGVVVVPGADDADGAGLTIDLVPPIGRILLINRQQVPG